VPKKIWFWIAVIWTVIIGVLCLVSFNDLPGVKLANADKYVHATFHFFFVVFWQQYLRNSGSGIKISRIFGRVFSLSIIYGCLIEIAQQYLTTTRQADLKDVLANFTGALLAIVLLIIADKFRKNQTA
jgi:VanZ family protein